MRSPDHAKEKERAKKMDPADPVAVTEKERQVKLKLRVYSLNVRYVCTYELAVYIYERIVCMRYRYICCRFHIMVVLQPARAQIPY